MGFYTNALMFLGFKEDSTSKVLSHTCIIASHANGCSNNFVPLLFCRLGDNHSVRQGRYKKGTESIQTRCFNTLSTVEVLQRSILVLGIQMLLMALL